MARIRYIKPEFFEDELMAVLPERVQLLYIGLWCHMDRGGVVKYSPAVLKGKIFPHSEITRDQFESMIEVLVKEKRLRKIEYQGKTYLYCVNFSRHQMVNKNERSKHKIPQEILESTIQVQYKYGSSTDQVSKELATSNGELATSNQQLATGSSCDEDHIRTFEKSFDKESLDKVQFALDKVFESNVPPDLKRAKPRILAAYGTAENFITCLEDIWNAEAADPNKNKNKWRNYISIAIKKQIGMIQDAS